MASLLQILSNPSVVSLVVAGVLAGWHYVTRSAASSSSTFGHAIDAARSAAQSIVQTIAPGSSADELAAKVLNSTKALLAAAGVDTNKMSPLAAAAINAVVHDAVSSFTAKGPSGFVDGKPLPPSPALHAAIVNLSQNPPARAV